MGFPFIHEYLKLALMLFVIILTTDLTKTPKSVEVEESNEAKQVKKVAIQSPEALRQKLNELIQRAREQQRLISEWHKKQLRKTRNRNRNGQTQNPKKKE
jgi:hypothetical protein